MLCTDGVTEAFNAGQELYGADRLVEVLRTIAGPKPAYRGRETELQGPGCLTVFAPKASPESCDIVPIRPPVYAKA